MSIIGKLLITGGPLQLRAAAEHYADGLVVGDRILEETDASVIRPFRHLLPGVLANRGLLLEETPGGYVVTQALWAASVAPPAKKPAFTCRGCMSNWFACGCSAGSFVLVNWPDSASFATMIPKHPTRATA